MSEEESSKKEADETESLKRKKDVLVREVEVESGGTVSINTDIIKTLMKDAKIAEEKAVEYKLKVEALESEVAKLKEELSKKSSL